MVSARTKIAAYLSPILGLCFTPGMYAQQAPEPAITPQAVATVPRLIRISNTFRPANGLPAAPVESATFSVYSAQTGGTPLWQETQNINVDAEGHYTVLMGLTLNDGVPLDLFSSSEPRWLGVQFNRPGETEQPRVRMASVPYALKASDSETLGGLPASAYLRAPSETSGSSGAASAGSAATTVESSSAVQLKPHIATGGTVTPNTISMFFDSAGDLTNSVMFQSNGNIGIGLTTPLYPLSIGGTNSALATAITIPNLGGYSTQDSAGGYRSLIFMDNSNPDIVHVRNNQRGAGGTVSLDSRTGGAPSVTILSNGNVGIGTTTPLYPLSIGGTNSGLASAITIPNLGSYATQDSAGSYRSLFFMDNSNPDIVHVRNNQRGVGGTVSLDSQPGGAPSVTILSNGNVGIGTTTPAYKLDIAGSINIAGTINGNNPSGTGNAVQGTSNSPNGAGLVGTNSASSGSGGAGVQGNASAANTFGVAGINSSSSGLTAGTGGIVSSPNGFGVWGKNQSTVAPTSGAPGAGVQGTAQVAGIPGVYGFNNATSGYAVGVLGGTASTSGAAVQGYAGTAGVIGVAGLNGAISGYAVGTEGSSSSPQGVGVQAVNWNCSAGSCLLVPGTAAQFQTATNGTLLVGQSGAAGANNNTATQAFRIDGQGDGYFAGWLQGNSNGGNPAVQGNSSTGTPAVQGNNTATSGYAVGVQGSSASPGGVGIWGVNQSCVGGPCTVVQGTAGLFQTASDGVLLQGLAGPSGGNVGTQSTVFTVDGQGNGTFSGGVNAGGGLGASGTAIFGGVSAPNGNGVIGSNSATTGYAFGVQGFSSSSTGIGVQGSSAGGVAVAGFTQTCSGGSCTLVSGTAGEFVTAAGGTVLSGIGTGGQQVFVVDSTGNLKITGTLTANTVNASVKNFKIDDPLDPQHKSLYHASIESSEMINVYSGNVLLDRKGEAVVTLPNWFEALNGDFRYQLTTIGGSARVYVAREIQNHQFKIAGGRRGMKVSWQVTGVRHDTWAQAHPMQVEQAKEMETAARR
jgi:trimeric autotransporter adhesin